VNNFQKIIWNYYNKNKRNFPWRNTKDPYKILVSEIMLQQTQTSRVVVKYKEFLKKFPTLKDLAGARLSEVLKVWIGLGYNRRAKYLHECAKAIVKDYKGKFPKDFNALIKLPGIGQSSAGAILNFAFNIPTPFIETNIRTVYIHHFFKDKTNILDKEIFKIISKTLDTKNSREWFYALYDHGSYLKSTLTTNPSRRSSHYKKQSVFKGSFREKRAFVLKSLLEKPLTNIQLTSLLKKHFNISDPDQIINSLLTDRLISKKGKLYFAG